ncbi:uncharacterized protein LOC127278964 [Leptopilina boulardi]|uniref:uncharacterized protein LOC127278964 n=1 Tax=Leptopilina boulardi TaxID=63433 RepID=UPI0021F61EE5|nr:uncharacterized protein LOC127278964 [Leptopilina boulardi]
MILNISDVCAFANATASTRNFLEGEKLLHAGHLLFCGKEAEEDNLINLIAFCIQSSKIKDAPHEIKRSLLNGKINLIKCSCTAGQSQKCKHVVATLLLLTIKNTDELDSVSFTDKKCLWDNPRTACLEQYEPAPIEIHDCCADKFKKEYSFSVSDETKKKLKSYYLLVIRIRH